MILNNLRFYIYFLFVTSVHGFPSKNVRYFKISPIFQTSDEDGEALTRKQILRAEAEAPFLTFRKFLYTGLIASAGLGILHK